MANKSVDKIFLDGALIASCSDSSLDIIIRFGYEKPRLSSSEFNEKGKISRLLANWKELSKYEKRYPDSDYIKKIKEVILKNAKNDLPEEIYNKIYQ